MTHKRNLQTRLQEYLPALKSREMTNRDVAALLGVNEQYLSRVLSDMDFQKDPAPDREAQSAAVKAKKENIRLLANDPKLTPEEAAAKAGVSLRTIYRYKGK
jgi:transcriptional regulator with XRE-family HTH domain